ncbi:hypothetical protein SLA2020_014770 [Shorea laevis]
MAKTGVFSSDSTVIAKATELKKELQKLVKTIVDDDDYSIETIDQAKETLSTLKELEGAQDQETIALLEATGSGAVS